MNFCPSAHKNKLGLFKIITKVFFYYFDRSRSRAEVCLHKLAGSLRREGEASVRTGPLSVPAPIPSQGLYLSCVSDTLRAITPETDEGLKIAAAQRWTLDVTDISISEEESTIFEAAVLGKKPVRWNYGDIS